MRIVMLLALSSALTGSLFLTRALIVQLNRPNGDRIIVRTRPDDSTNEKAILYDQPYSPPKKWTILHLSAAALKTYTGLYEFPQIGLNFRVWVEDGAAGKNLHRKKE